MAIHQWQCRACGKKSSLLNSANPNPTPPKIGGTCPNAGNGQHTQVKIK